MVVPRGGRETWKREKHAGVGIGRGEGYRGDQHDSVQVNLVAILEDSRELRGARGAVTFADQIFRRTPALISRDVLVDEIGKPGGVFDYAVELIRDFRRARDGCSR